MRESESSLLIDRLATSIVDESLPLKDVEKELRGCVAEVAIKRRGLGKREIASRCGVTEKSIDNYLKEVRSNPKSPEREISRLLQDEPLTLEEIYEKVRPILCHGRHFTLDDAKRAVDKLIRTGEAQELPGKKYGSSERPSILVPLTVDAYRDLVEEKARDLDYIILTHKELTEGELPSRKKQQFSRVVGDTNLVRIDFTVDIPEGELGEFYEKLSAEIARFTLKYEKKRGATRLRVILGMRTVLLLFALLLNFAFAGLQGLGDRVRASGSAADSIAHAGQSDDSWELDNRGGAAATGGGMPGPNPPPNPVVDNDDPVAPGGDGDDPSQKDRRKYTPVFVRGDATLDRRIDVTDVLVLVTHFTQGTELGCEDAADINDDGQIDIADAVGLVVWLFLKEPTISTDPAGAIGGPIGPDRTDDSLTCIAGETMES